MASNPENVSIWWCHHGLHTFQKSTNNVSYNYWIALQTEFTVYSWNMQWKVCYALFCFIYHNFFSFFLIMIIIQMKHFTICLMWLHWHRSNPMLAQCQLNKPLGFGQHCAASDNKVGIMTTFGFSVDSLQLPQSGWAFSTLVVIPPSPQMDSLVMHGQISLWWRWGC